MLRHTACGDAGREPGADLTAYYTESGNPPGRWHGTGLAGLGAGCGLAAGTTVTEEAMGRLFGTGHDPVAGLPLGRPFPVFRPVAERVAQRLARVPDTLADPDRAAAIAEIEQTEQARPGRAAVAGFDLTFTVPKSASVLWAIGEAAVRQAVADAHTEAVTATLGWLEDRFLHTRVGKHSCAQVSTRGLIAAAFDHWDTRTGPAHGRCRSARCLRRARAPARRASRAHERARLHRIAKQASASLDRADVMLDETGATIARTQTILTATERFTIRTDGVLDESEGITARTDVLLTDTERITTTADRLTVRATGLGDQIDPLVTAAAPLAQRFVSRFSEAEVDAAIALVDELPGLVRSLREDVIPLLATLEHTGPDITELLEVTHEVKQAILGIPGFGFFRKRGAELEDQEADQAT